jgi:predicted ATPase
LAELGRRAEGRGYLVLDGRAAEFERDVPFGLIVDALNDYLGALQPAVLRTLDEAALGELASILPALFKLGVPAHGRLAAERFRAHYAIRAVLERLASRQPVVVALDDVHWADPASTEVIAHVMRRFRGPLLGAFAVRQAPPRLVAAFETAAREGFGSELAVAPLTLDEARALIGPGFDALAGERLYRESGGNPFYLEQLARATDARVAGPMFAIEHPSEAVAPPPGVAAAIRQELANLSSDSRVVLDAAAVAGESFEPELVGAIAAASTADTLQAFDELLDVDLIRGADSPRRFRFRHPVVRRTVYDGIPNGWRLGAHARAAAALQTAHAPVAACAHHIERSALAGDEAAIAVLIEAARSVAAQAPFTTARWLLAALRLLPASAEGERRLALLGEAAAALVSAGAYDEAFAALTEALGLVPGDRPYERADIVVKLNRVDGRAATRPIHVRCWNRPSRRSRLTTAARPSSFAPSSRSTAITAAISIKWAAGPRACSPWRVSARTCC